MLEDGTLLFHITAAEIAQLIMLNGIRLQGGNVNALGQGFYTVENLVGVFEWNQAEDLNNLLNGFSVVFSRVIGPTPVNEVVNNNTKQVGNGNNPLRIQGDFVWKNYNGNSVGSIAQGIEVIGHYTVQEILNFAENPDNVANNQTIQNYFNDHREAIIGVLHSLIADFAD